MAEHAVGSVEELRAARRVVLELEGRAVGIFSIGDAFYALRSRCPHQGGPLCDGIVVPALRARLDDRKHMVEFFDESMPVVACPWHGIEFEIKTGVCLANREWRVRTYSVHVRNEHVYVVV